MDHSISRFKKRSLSAWFTLFFIAGLFVSITAGSASANDIVVAPKLAPSPAPVVDGVISAGEWDQAKVTYLPRTVRGAINRKFAVMRTMNDTRYLYVLIDALGDTTNDEGVSDYYVLAFDTDLNHKVTPRQDMFYSPCNGGKQFVKSYYLSTTTFTPCMTPNPYSLGKYGFGATPDSSTPHRFYEFRLLLSELGVDPARWVRDLTGIPSVRMNVTIRSARPSIDYSYPTAYPWPDMTGTMFLIALAPATSVAPTGNIFAGVGLIPASYIGGDGYANISTSYFNAVDSPFGGNLSIFGNWSNLRKYGAAKYRINYVKHGGGSGYLAQSWTNYRFNASTLNWDPVAIGTVDSSNRYAVPSAADTWYYANLLINWQSSSALFPDDIYDLSIELFDASDNLITLPTGVVNNLTLFIDNTPPAPKINQVYYKGGKVSPCDIVQQGASPDGFTFDISVNDANGALNTLNLTAIYGDNLSSPVYSDSYSSHLNADGPNKWNGVNTVVPTSGAWRAPQTCGYSFILSASSRVLNGYTWVFPYVDYHVSLAIQVSGVIAPSAEKGSGECESCKEAAGGTHDPSKPAGL